CWQGPWYLLDLVAGKVIRELDRATIRQEAVAIAPEGDLMITYVPDPSGESYDAACYRLSRTATGETVWELPFTAGWTGPMTFSPNGDCVAIARNHGPWGLQSITIFKVAPGRAVRTFQVPATCLAFTADGTQFVAIDAHHTGTMTRCEVATGKQVRKTQA